MGNPVRRRAGARAVQCALVAVLLALTGLIGLSAEQSPAPATTHSVSVDTPTTWLSEGSAFSPEAAGSHAHDTISLLCLCALVMVGVLLVARRDGPLRVSGQRSVRTPSLVGGVLRVVPTTASDPLCWGVCRR